MPRVDVTARPDHASSQCALLSARSGRRCWGCSNFRRQFLTIPGRQSRNTLPQAMPALFSHGYESLESVVHYGSLLCL